MVDFTEGISLGVDDKSPFERTVEKCEEKLAKRVDGYPSKHLLLWCDQAMGNSLTIMTFDGEDPLIEEPDRSETPALILYPVATHEIEAVYNQTAPREVYLTLRFEGWLYTRDQSHLLRFYWLFLNAIGSPYLKQGYDVLYGPNGVPELDHYWPSSPWTPHYGRLKDGGDEVASFEQDITFRYTIPLFA